MNIKNPENKYRPIPFWSWNEKLDTIETARQIELMSAVGMGGYFMHARGGLQTEYMGEQWFDNVNVGVDEGEKFDMGAWAYDENGWPSGFGSGIVNGKGIKYQQKYLRFEEGEKQTEQTICNVGGYHFYYDVNPFYVDTLDGEVIKVFIDEIYQPYYDKYKNSIEGFFTDEPQISRNGIPWSFIMPDEYKKAYGEDLLQKLIELFKPVGDYKQTRLNFWKLVTDLFSKNFMKQIYDWCDSRGLKLTGHLVCEDNLKSQLAPNGAVMPHYDYFHIPGMDWLSRNMRECLTMLQLCSVAHQLGKKQILTECFAMCGHNIGFDGLKGLLEWQMVRGVTLLCPHLEGYSLRGIRKRDYPPALFYQQPWWDDYKNFIDAMSRIGMLLTEGVVEYDALLIHPQSTAWVCFDNDKNEGLMECNDELLKTMNTLDRKHILFHLGDETIMERHARVEGNAIIIGTQKYKTVILPLHEILFESTQKLLDEYKANGGVIKTVAEVEENTIISNPEITYTKRSYKEFDLYYFVNSTTENHKAEISVGNKIIDISSGDTKPFYGDYIFKPFDSLVVIDDKQERQQKPAEKELKHLDLSGSWQINGNSPNALTLDYCDYYFDDELVEKNGYVLNIQNRACELKRPVQIRCEYKIKVEDIPFEAYLVCETPDIFKVEVNGKEIRKKDCGFYIDSSFRRIDIAKYLINGDNKITLTIDFKQSEVVYENLAKSAVFESEKNKLTYDMEIEPIYIVGDFSVQTEGNFEKLDKDAVRYNGDFVVSQSKTELSLVNIEQQGYPFFAGSITLSKTFDLLTTDYKIKLNKKGVNVIKIKVNGGEEKKLLWEPFELDISEMLKIGENKVEITITNNLRNLLGPHHLEEGESYAVSPRSFYKEKCVWNLSPSGNWNDDYCFAEVSI